MDTSKIKSHLAIRQKQPARKNPVQQEGKAGLAIQECDLDTPVVIEFDLDELVILEFDNKFEAASVLALVFQRIAQKEKKKRDERKKAERDNQNGHR